MNNLNITPEGIAKAQNDFIEFQKLLKQILK